MKKSSCAKPQKRGEAKMEDTMREFFFIHRTDADDFYCGGEPGSSPKLTKETLDAARYSDRDAAEDVIKFLARSTEEFRKPRSLETVKVKITTEVGPAYWTALR
jgi:hypothetical protein